MEGEMEDPDQLALYNHMVNQSQMPINDFNDPMLEKFMRSQALSNNSEM